MSTKIPILSVYDENGNRIPIPAIRGKSAYQYAEEGGYSGTEAEFAELLGGLGKDAIPWYWDTDTPADGQPANYLTNKINDIKNLQSEGGKDCFSFVVMTDMHLRGVADNVYTNLGRKSPLLAKEIMDRCNIKYALNLGDVCSRGVWDSKEEVTSEFDEIADMLSPLKGRLLSTQGNHDGNYGKFDKNNNGTISNYVDGVLVPPTEREEYVYGLTPAEMFERIYREAGMCGDVTYDESGTGYYIDDVSNRVRFIMLNISCNPYELNENGTVKYPNMWVYRYTQSQFDMVIDALSTLKKGWSAVIGSHVPVSQSVGDRELMQGVLNAFKTKGKYSGEYAGTAAGGIAYKNLAEPLPDNTTDNTKWAKDWRLQDGGVVGSQTGTTLSNKIYCSLNQKVRVKGVNFRSSKDRYGCFNDDDTPISSGAGYIHTSDVLKPTEFVSIELEEDGTYVFTPLKGGTKTFSYMRFAFETPSDTSTVIITVDEEIVEGTASGYDAVSVNCDFTQADGELIAFFAGHTHIDSVVENDISTNNALGFKAITTRCDAREENTDPLKNERVADTITEQSFDVFTVNKKTRTIHATKIGAGENRTITY